VKIKCVFDVSKTKKNYRKGKKKVCFQNRVNINVENIFSSVLNLIYTEKKEAISTLKTIKMAIAILTEFALKNFTNNASLNNSKRY